MIRGLAKIFTSLWTRLSDSLSPPGVAILFVLMAIIIGVAGFHRQFYPELELWTFLREIPQWFGKAFEAFYTNWSAGLIEIALTILIVDRLYDRLNMRDTKNALKRDLGSSDENIARNAAARLKTKRDEIRSSWLEDGSCKGIKLKKAKLVPQLGEDEG